MQRILMLRKARRPRSPGVLPHPKITTRPWCRNPSQSVKQLIPTDNSPVPRTARLEWPDNFSQAQTDFTRESTYAARLARWPASGKEDCPGTKSLVAVRYKFPYSVDGGGGNGFVPCMQPFLPGFFWYKSRIFPASLVLTDPQPPFPTMPR
ncbi:hypothetical protein VTI74DRAFT_6260 [Chaetomium olivicolor]